MRFLFFGLLFLSIAIRKYSQCLNSLMNNNFSLKFLVSESLGIDKLNTRDDWMEKTENLRILVKRKIEEFKSDGKHLLVGGLEKLEKEIFNIEIRIKNANLDGEFGKIIRDSLVESFNNAENDFDTEVKILTSSSVKT